MVVWWEGQLEVQRGWYINGIIAASLHRVSKQLAARFHRIYSHAYEHQPAPP